MNTMKLLFLVCVLLLVHKVTVTKSETDVQNNGQIPSTAELPHELSLLFQLDDEAAAPAPPAEGKDDGKDDTSEDEPAGPKGGKKKACK